MDTAVAIVGAYLHLNGYVAIPEQPILVGQGRPWRYHTATDLDILAIRFPHAAVVVPRDSGGKRDRDEDLLLAVDPKLDLHDDTVDVLIGEVKESRPRLNEALRDPEILYAALRRFDADFDQPLEKAVERLVKRGEATCEAAGRRWRFRLAAFGTGTPVREGAPFKVISLTHIVLFLMKAMAEHRQVWRDAQFSDQVLDVLHLLDKLGLTLVPRDDENAEATKLAAKEAADVEPPEVPEGSPAPIDSVRVSEDGEVVEEREITDYRDVMG